MIVAMGCSNDEGSDSAEDTIRLPVKANITAFEAVELVQRYAFNADYTVPVQVPYAQSTEVPCSDAEVEADRNVFPNNPELWTCKPIATGSSSYVKSVQAGDCCESKDVLLPRKTDTSWEAEYTLSSDTWKVVVEFSVDNQQQSVYWTAGDSTRTVSDPQ